MPGIFSCPAHVAEDLSQYRHWQPYLHDLGECEVKHGLRLHLVNLYKDNLGNPHVPDKLKRRRRWNRRPLLASVRDYCLLGPSTCLPLFCSFQLVALAISFSVFYRRGSPTIAQTPSQEVTGAVPPIPEKSIAVLPFENLSDQKENAYFADGVQDEILTALAKIADLKVISRMSTMQYKTMPEHNLREIANALGVAHVLQGTVQRAGGRVRVNAQLIDARTDTQLWAERLRSRCRRRIHNRK